MNSFVYYQLKEDKIPLAERQPLATPDGDANFYAGHRVGLYLQNKGKDYIYTVENNKVVLLPCDHPDIKELRIIPLRPPK